MGSLPLTKIKHQICYTTASWAVLYSTWKNTKKFFPVYCIYLQVDINLGVLQEHPKDTVMPLDSWDDESSGTLLVLGVDFSTIVKQQLSSLIFITSRRRPYTSHGTTVMNMITCTCTRLNILVIKCNTFPCMLVLPYYNMSTLAIQCLWPWLGSHSCPGTSDWGVTYSSTIITCTRHDCYRDETNLINNNQCAS